MVLVGPLHRFSTLLRRVCLRRIRSRRGFFGRRQAAENAIAAAGTTGQSGAAQQKSDQGSGETRHGGPWFQSGLSMTVFSQ